MSIAIFNHIERLQLTWFSTKAILGCRPTQAAIKTRFLTFFCAIIVMHLCDPAVAGTTYIDVTDASRARPAVHDAVWGRTDCSIANTGGGGATQLTCPAPSGIKFGSLNDGQTVVIDDAGPNYTPYIAKMPASITAATLTVTLTGTPATYINALSHVTALNPSAAGSGYQFGSTQTFSATCTGCVTAVAAKGTPGEMTVISVTIDPSNEGSGGGSALSCILIPAGQTAINGAVTQVTVNLTGGMVSSVRSIGAGNPDINDSGTYSGGSYSDPMVPLSTVLNPISSCPGLTGVKLFVTYGVTTERLVQGTGSYVNAPGDTLPCGSGPMSSSSNDSGTMLTVTCSGYYPSTVSYGTDNTTAFQSVVTSLNAASAASNAVCAYIPAGNYMTNVMNAAGGFTYAVTGYGCWLGDEHYNSNVFVIPNTAGDMFAWYRSNMNSTQIGFANTQDFSNYQSMLNNANQAGASFRDITIIGNRASALSTGAPALQNGLMFYGKTEFAYIDNWVVSHLRGRAFGGGFQDSSSTGDFNESRVQNGHLDNDGDSPYPASSGSPTATFEITAFNADGSNTDTFDNLRVFDSWGPGFWLNQGGNASNNVRAIEMLNIVSEGSGMSQWAVQSDLFKLGNSAVGSTNFNVPSVHCRNLELLNPVLGYAAFRIAANPTNATGTQNIDCQGAITTTPSSQGRGLQFDACQFCSIKLASNTTVDYGFILGTVIAGTGCSASYQSSATIDYDGNGNEGGLSTCFDITTVSLVRMPVKQFLAGANPISPQSNPPPDLTSTVNFTGNVTFRVFTTPNVSINPIAPLWIILRTGNLSVANNDQWDTAANFISRLNFLASQTVSGTSFAAVGQVFRARVCNENTVTDTIVPNPSGDVGDSVTLAPGGCGTFALTLTGVTTPGLSIIGQAD